MRPLALLLLAALTLAGCGPARGDTVVRLPDGRRLRLACEGRGSPVVLFESGFGATAEAWSKVKPLLSGANHVCSYDRAGYGGSDAGPMPRDGASVAEDLDEGVRAASLNGPFVVVGHSAGGLYVRLFADRRPKDVVGMVLVDPSVEHQDQAFSMFGPNAASVAPIRNSVERCLELATSGDKARSPAEKARCYDRTGKALPASLWTTQLSELDTLWGVTSAEVAEGRASFGDMPLVVLTAGGTYKAVPEPWRDALDARWRELHRDIARRSSRGEERLVADSSHLIMIDRPDAVAQAIRDVLGEVKATSPHGRP
ncbi:MAG: alpha/beta fold hydrolase [Caulobacteraceae bacterium]